MKDYEILLLLGEQVVYQKSVYGNYQRLNVVELGQCVNADTVKVHVTATNGWPEVRIFEVRVYSGA